MRLGGNKACGCCHLVLVRFCFDNTYIDVFSRDGFEAEEAVVCAKEQENCAVFTSGRVFRLHLPTPFAILNVPTPFAPI